MSGKRRKTAKRLVGRDVTFHGEGGKGKQACRQPQLASRSTFQNPSRSLAAILGGRIQKALEMQPLVHIEVDQALPAEQMTPLEHKRALCRQILSKFRFRQDLKNDRTIRYFFYKQRSRKLFCEPDCDRLIEAYRNMQKVQKMMRQLEGIPEPDGDL